MRRIALALLLALGLAGGMAGADPAERNDGNTHGRCTSYFNGSENGQDHKREAGPFTAFAQYVGENDGRDNDGDDATDEEGEVASEIDIWDWCMDPTNNPKGIGGQPDDPNTEENDGNGNNGNGNG